MPYYQYDIDEFDEDTEYDEEEEDEKEPERTEEMYEPAGGTVRFDADPFMKTVRDELVEEGITAVNCHYDGGYDEGYARFDNAVRGQTVLGPAELVDLLKYGPIADPSLTRQMYAGFPPQAFESMFDGMAATPTGLRIAQAMEEFAFKLATVLLGNGYGTGEYKMRGRFRADLETGQLTDLKDED